MTTTNSPTANSPAATEPTTAARSQPGVWPGLRYTDAPTAIRFLVDVVGFEETFVVPGDDGTVAHAELLWPTGGGVMLGSTRHDQGVHADMKAGVTSVYVVTDDPEAVHQRVVAAGADIDQGLETSDYGSLGFTLRDPEGNQWTFGTYAGTTPGAADSGA